MITVEQVKTTLAAVAGEDGEHQDARASRRLEPRYVEHGEPCCLVAVVLHRLGFTVAQLRQLDTEAGTAGGGIVFRESRHPLLKRIDPAARPLLAYIQDEQDAGRPWAEVADRALQRGRFDPAQHQGWIFNRPRPHPWNE